MCLQLNPQIYTDFNYTIADGCRCVRDHLCWFIQPSEPATVVLCILCCVLCVFMLCVREYEFVQFGPVYKTICLVSITILMFGLTCCILPPCGLKIQHTKSPMSHKHNRQYDPMRPRVHRTYAYSNTNKSSVMRAMDIRMQCGILFDTILWLELLNHQNSTVCVCLFPRIRRSMTIRRMIWMSLIVRVNVNGFKNTV